MSNLPQKVTPRRLHIAPQLNGGIGKSFVARVLCEYFEGSTAFDLDPLDRTLSSITALHARLVSTTADADAIDMVLNEMATAILENQSPDVVIDVGPPTNMRLLKFIEESSFFDQLAQDGTVPREVWFHLIAVGGAREAGTREAIDQTIGNWEDRVKILLWDNLYFGKIMSEEVDTRFSKVVISNPWSMDDITYVLANAKTFGEMRSEPIPKTKLVRIEKYWRSLATQLDAVFSV